MTNIYDQHRATFANVSAFVILKDGDRVATIAFKFGAAVTVYAHWIGLEMVRGRAGGGGYDRKTAACADAARKIKFNADPERFNIDRKPEDRAAFTAALSTDCGQDWNRKLEDAGFTVLQAV